MCSSLADFAHHAILQNTLSLKAKLPERELRKSAEPLGVIPHKLKNMSIEVHIDSITLDILSKRLKNIVSPMDILKWLNNFQKDETKIALDYLYRFTIYTSNEIEEIFHESLNQILRKLKGQQKAIIHPIGKFGKSGSMMSYLLKKTNSFKCNDEKLYLTSDYTEFDNLYQSYSTLILVDDFVGTGKSILDYLTDYIKNRLDLFEKVYFICVAGMEIGIKNINQKFDEIFVPKSNIYKKAFSSDASYFGYRNFGLHRQVAYEYGSKLTKPVILKCGKKKFPNALGYENTQALIGFFYGCPNNTLPIFWKESDNQLKWSSLLPRFNEDKISKAKHFRKNISFELSLLKEFGTERLQKEFINYEIIRGKKKYNSVNHINFSLYAILKLLREGNNEVSICQKLGILHSDYVNYLKIGKNNGIFTSKFEISLKGLELYNDAKKCIKNSFAYKHENRNEFNSKNIIFIPKTFNGRS